MEEDKIIAEFVRRKHKVDVTQVEIKETKSPWYLRPIEREAFISRIGKDGKFYAQHNEWCKRVWIGPYTSQKEVDAVIDSYVTESLKGRLDKKPIDSIHSLTVENEQEFFGK